MWGDVSSRVCLLRPSSRGQNKARLAPAQLFAGFYSEPRRCSDRLLKAAAAFSESNLRGPGSTASEESGVNVPALVFWRLSFVTSLRPCLRSTTLTCSQWARSPPPPPPFFHHYSPAFFFFFSHTHAQRWGEKNDLSAAHNSLHFYRPEWSCSTKGDIIFSGFDWPPPCHRMTSCKTAPHPTPPSK